MSERKGTKALELWCKRLIKDCPEIQIENMTTSWRNGMAFCALVHHFRPDLIDMSKLKPENIYDNNQLAFSVAEKHLGIPALLDPEDMVENDVPDRLSVLTYLSQFYQRLGHTVKTKVSESESNSPKSTTESSQPTAPIKFGRTGLDKCTACGLPVYLAQRLMVSHKLYHRRCFRCSKCSGHLNPKNYHVIEGSEFSCDSCKNEMTLFKYLNNNDHDQMGMLAFSDNKADANIDVSQTEVVSPKIKSRPSSILERINMFEKNDKDTSINSKGSNLSMTDSTTNNTHKELSDTGELQNERDEKETSDDINMSLEMNNFMPKNIPEKVYKSNLDKFNFLQTQLSGDSILELDKTAAQKLEENDKTHEDEDFIKNNHESLHKLRDEKKDAFKTDVKEDLATKEETNITDDIRIAKNPITVNSAIVDKTLDDSKKSDNPAIANLSISETEAPLDDVVLAKKPATTNLVLAENDTSIDDTKKTEEVTISVPPRRKKPHGTGKSSTTVVTKQEAKMVPKEYPDHLNPFSDDEEDQEQSKECAKKESTNPFGSSDEEDDEVPPIQPPPKAPGIETSTPVKRLIAVNPFWSDGEEPSTDEEEEHSRSSKGTYSSLATSTPNLPGAARRRKPRAPPPPVLPVGEASRSHATSMDDVASISSLSSFNSTAHSDQKSYEKSTPRLRKRLAPTPPESISGYGSIEKGIDTSETKNMSGFDGGKKKGPAPGLPLPERREVKLQMSAEELQVQLDLLETQQLGLERQGVLIERMIRDKCEGDEASTVPQEEVEDLVIQLCELVNEKNDLFRKQTELMYIRRQQRLEQEQADIEHEIRIIQSRPAVNRIDADKLEEIALSDKAAGSCTSFEQEQTDIEHVIKIIQSRPAVNRIDADKAREEQLVSRLVEIVRMRDELVQQLDAERRRERQEDLAIATSIATKRAQRNSDSNSSSMKSSEPSATTVPKKNKVKDKVKKQFKKAKHTLIPKKKDDSAERKEGKEDKMKKEEKSK